METSTIISELLHEEPNKKLVEIFYTSRFERLLLMLIGIVTLIFIPLYFIDGLEGYSMLFLMLALLLILLFILGANIYGVLSDVLNPAQGTLNSTRIRLERQNFLINKIARYPIWDIENTQLRIEQDIVIFQSRSKYLVGAFDKLGIIPAVLALYLATIGDANTAHFPLDNGMLFNVNISFYVGMFVVGTYIGAFLATGFIAKYQEFSLVLKQAKKLAEKNGNHD